MSCTSCLSDRIASVTAKCSDCFDVCSNKAEYSGYVPKDIGIGGNDYIAFDYCLNCGKIQGNFPVTPEFETQVTNDQLIEFYSEYIIEGEPILFNKTLTGQVIKSAENVSPMFGKWFTNFMNNNSRHDSYHYDNVYNYPTCSRLIEMFRDNNPYL